MNVGYFAQGDDQTSSVGVYFLMFSIMFIFVSVYLVFWGLALWHLFQHKDIDSRTFWFVLVLLVPLASVVYFYKVLLPYNRAHPLKPSLD